MNGPLLIEYAPPVILMGVGELMPAMVTLFEVISVLVATLLCAVNANALGVVSSTRFVALNTALTPPMVKVALLVAPEPLVVVCCTVTLCPF